jgi:uncharacterized membrane protein YqjE
MAVGLLLIAMAVSFLLTLRAPGVDPNFRLDPIAAGVCSLAVIGVGGLLLLSTYGRTRKVRATRESSPARKEG